MDFSAPLASLNPDRRAAAERLLAMAAEIQLAVHRTGFHAADLAAVARQAPTDVLYRLDEEVDRILRRHFETWGPAGGVAVTGEGFERESRGGMGATSFPSAHPPPSPRWHVLLDPVDGTRGLMWGKRPGFFLAALAEGAAPKTYRESFFAVVAELPTTRMYLADTFHAVRGRGTCGETVHLLDGTRTPRPPSPYSGTNLRHGFAGVARYFAPGRAFAAELDDELMETLVPELAAGKPLVFEDQFITSGGQLFEILAGRDRFVADVRGWISKRRSAKGLGPLMTSHPYDLAGALVATEAGLTVTDVRGQPLDFPWNTEAVVDYVACANDDLRRIVAPVLEQIMLRRDPGLFAG